MRKQFTRAIESARPAIKFRSGEGPASITPPEDDFTFWQVEYNRACYDAIRSVVDGPEAADIALSHLETALERPGGNQMKGSWVKKDPDLKLLRPLPRFKELQSMLEDDGSDDADGA